MNNHTPAPWTIEYDHATNTPELIRAPFDGEMLDVASVLCSETGNSEADASLISAAPELLAVAEQALAAFNYLSIKAKSKADREEFKRRETAARYAIAKATGILQ